MHRSNMEDSGGWNRYWYERTGVPQAAQIRRSPSETVSQVPILRQCCRPIGALQVVMPSILSRSESLGTAVPAKRPPGSKKRRPATGHEAGRVLSTGEAYSRPAHHKVGTKPRRAG